MFNGQLTKHHNVIQEMYLKTASKKTELVYIVNRITVPNNTLKL